MFVRVDFFREIKKLTRRISYVCNLFIMVIKVSRLSISKLNPCPINTGTLIIWNIQQGLLENYLPFVRTIIKASNLSFGSTKLQAKFKFTDNCREILERINTPRIGHNNPIRKVKTIIIITRCLESINFLKGM